ncbi:MAG TPA: DUF3016 domain-containing protein [Usitatibacter sp.]|nr:DUF3016 domain-containing protein [Usitatibacter sp.]
MTIRFLLAAAALAALPSQAATVVTFADPDRFTDVANQRWETQTTLDALAGHMKRLGDRYIAPNDTLRIEVLDIDLAGWARMGGNSPNEVRVLRGKADFPSMKVRYTLESRGATSTREATISDPTYMNHGTRINSSESFHYEKRMLDDWFRSTFGERSR